VRTLEEMGEHKWDRLFFPQTWHRDDFLVHIAPVAARNPAFAVQLARYGMAEARGSAEPETAIDASLMHGDLDPMLVPSAEIAILPVFSSERPELWAWTRILGCAMQADEDPQLVASIAERLSFQYSRLNDYSDREEVVRATQDELLMAMARNFANLEAVVEVMEDTELRRTLTQTSIGSRK
jgi:hypothetical protein